MEWLLIMIISIPRYDNALTVERFSTEAECVAYVEDYNSTDRGWLGARNADDDDWKCIPIAPLPNPTEQE